MGRCVYVYKFYTCIKQDIVIINCDYVTIELSFQHVWFQNLTRVHRIKESQSGYCTCEVFASLLTFMLTLLHRFDRRQNGSIQYWDDFHWIGSICYLFAPHNNLLAKWLTMVKIDKSFEKVLKSDKVWQILCKVLGKKIIRCGLPRDSVSRKYD